MNMKIYGSNTIGELISNPQKKKYINPPRDWLKYTKWKKCRSCWATAATKIWISIEKVEDDEKNEV